VKQMAARVISWVMSAVSTVMKVVSRSRPPHPARNPTPPARVLTERTGKGGPDGEAQLRRALGAVVLEGPSEAAATARQLVDCLRRHEAPDDLDRAKSVFVSVVQELLLADAGR
jgi:hypothetical protein